MKSRRLAEILSVGAVSLAVWSAPGLAQTTINVPKSVTDYYESDDTDDACVALREDYSEAAEDLTYVGFLNKDYCTAKKAALDKAAEIAEEDLAGEVESTAGARDTAFDELELARQAYLKALADKEVGDAELLRLQGELAAKQAEADALAADLAAAFQKVAVDFFGSDSEFDDFDAYVDGNPEDENVIAYLAARDAFEAGRRAVTTAQTDITDYEDGDYSELLSSLSAAAEDYFGGDLGSLAEPTEDSKLGVYQAALVEYTLAQEALDEAVAALALLESAAEAALAADVPSTRNDNILASATNPARAVLETSLCAASEEDDCNNDVGQAIVDGLDALHQRDESLDTRLTATETEVGSLGTRMGVAEDNIVDLQDRMGVAEENIVDLQGRMVIAEDDIVELKAGLATETIERKAADELLQANIDAETVARTAAITKESTERKAADTALQTAINNESAARAAADIVLDNKIKTLDTRVTQLGQRVDALTKESRQGIAMAMALAAIPTVNYGKFSLGLGVGTFSSETAAALGVDFVISERVKFKVGFTTTGDESGGSAGIAIGF